MKIGRDPAMSRVCGCVDKHFSGEKACDCNLRCIRINALTLLYLGDARSSIAETYHCIFIQQLISYIELHFCIKIKSQEH